MMPRGADKLTLSQMHMMGGNRHDQRHHEEIQCRFLPEMIRTAQQNGVRILAPDVDDLMGLKMEELLDGSSRQAWRRWQPPLLIPTRITSFSPH